jgi:hypothetical protein
VPLIPEIGKVNNEQQLKAGTVGNERQLKAVVVGDEGQRLKVDSGAIPEISAIGDREQSNAVLVPVAMRTG